jgi:hypothetical protein
LGGVTRARAPRAARRVVGGSILALALMLAALLATNAAVAPAARARPAGVPRCAASWLVIWLNAEDSGALGSFYYKLEFKNLSDDTCTLSGYPGVSAVNLTGHQVGAAAEREPTGTPSVLTLAPDAQATVLVHLTDVAVLPASCHATSAAGLRVYPPGETVSKVVPYPFRTCANAGRHDLYVRSLTHD